MNTSFIKIFQLKDSDYENCGLLIAPLSVKEQDVQTAWEKYYAQADEVDIDEFTQQLSAIGIPVERVYSTVINS